MKTTLKNPKPYETYVDSGEDLRDALEYKRKRPGLIRTYFSCLFSTGSPISPASSVDLEDDYEYKKLEKTAEKRQEKDRECYCPKR